MNFLEKVEQCGRRPHQACTTMIFFLLKNVTSERPIALLLTLIRWRKWLRAPEVSRWQEVHRVGWDATDGRNGVAEPTVWATLLGMDRFDYRAGETDQRAITLFLDLAKAVGRVESSSGVGLDDALLPKEDFACALRVTLSTRGRVQFERVRSGATPDYHSSSSRVEMELLLRVVLQDAFGEVMKVYPALKLKVFMDAFMEERNKESIRREVEEKGLKLSITEGGRERQSKVIALRCCSPPADNDCTPTEQKIQRTLKRDF